MNIHPKPPYWVDCFLRWRLPEEQFEEVQGDMHELYGKWVEEVGKKKATWQYILNALTFLRPLPKQKSSFQYKNKHYSQTNSFDMIQNYFKMALRNLRRQTALSAINIVGLSIGIACSIFILLWVTDELSYDRFHANVDRLYRVNVNSGDIKAAVSSPPIGPTMKAEIPQVLDAVRLSPTQNLFEVNNQKFEEENGFYVDSNFFNLFSYKLTEGNLANALSRPNGIIITEELALKYFGKEKAMGQILRLDNTHNFIVTGVAQKPTNSHLQFNYLLPLSFLAKTERNIQNNIWGGFILYTYILVAEGIQPASPALEQIEKQMNAIFLSHEKEFTGKIFLQPLSDVYFTSNLFVDTPWHGNMQYVRIFSVVAIFVLIIACINFMNLATARSAQRAKEVGLRKVVGANRDQLIWQFLSESIFIALLALLLAVGIVWVLLPAFNQLTDKNLSLNFLQPQLLCMLIGISLFSGLLSGIYPALFLSAFQPAEVFKGATQKNSRGAMLRNSLVVVQFVVSILLMVGTAVVYNQLQFIKNKNLGYNKENLIYVPMRGDLRQQFQVLQTHLAQNPLTNDFTIVSELPVELRSANDVDWEGKNKQEQVFFNTLQVDENFLKTFKVQLLQGREFSKGMNDKNNYLVNEAALKVMGMDKSEAIGKPFNSDGFKGVIIGVVKDFNFKPLRHTIEPLVMKYNASGAALVVRAKPGKTEATVKALNQAYQKLNPAFPFSFNFVDQDLDNLYKTEQRVEQLVKIFALLALFISCVGLYGLISFIAEQRSKEIGLRKVLGASVSNILLLLSKDFLRLIFIAFVIAAPLAWYTLSRWLEDFAYRIDIGADVFVLSALACLVIMLVTISHQSIKAAIANPIKSLRNE